MYVCMYVIMHVCVCVCVCCVCMWLCMCVCVCVCVCVCIYITTVCVVELCEGHEEGARCWYSFMIKEEVPYRLLSEENGNLHTPNAWCKWRHARHARRNHVLWSIFTGCALIMQRIKDSNIWFVLWHQEEEQTSSEFQGKHREPRTLDQPNSNCVEF